MKRTPLVRHKPLRAKKRVARPSLTSLKRKADRLWSQLILSKGQCEVCGRKATNPHHFISRTNRTLRHDPRNGVALCYRCHIGGNPSAHGDPIFITTWMMCKRPDDYNYLFEKREELATQVDYTQVITSLERKLKEKEDGNHNQ